MPYNNTETRRRILHLLYAFREYYYDGANETEAALKAAQVVANIIDFGDDVSDNPTNSGETEGPFYDAIYGSQANKDCTYITEAIIAEILDEVSTSVLGTVLVFPFGLDSADVIYGYERQPFIAEVYCEWDGGIAGSPLQAFAIELVNPYMTDIDLEDYTLEIESGGSFSLNGAPQIPAYDLIDGVGRLIIYRGTIPAVGAHVETHTEAGLPVTITQADDNTIRLLKTTPSGSGSADIVVDQVMDEDYDDHTVAGDAGTIFKDTVPYPGSSSYWSVTRDDSDWKFIQAVYSDVTENPTTLGGTKASVSVAGTAEGFQLGCPDDGYSVARLHDLEILSLFGSSEDSSDPNDAITQQIADAAAINDLLHFDLTEPAESPTDYVCTMNRPDYGTLPGVININTAPVHVIAAAIPPSIATLKSSGYDALTMAQEIVDNRPYAALSDLLSLGSFNHLEADGDNIGYTPANGGDDQAIMDDIEERDWILSHLANKFTVRSDVFTAYILVRLGEDGPQRRMIGIFDRSNVWDADDKPQLIALHPVPDPR
ncbi:MAG: hypothetical protein ACYTET_07395 [Planctomycetota bacterium]